MTEPLRIVFAGTPEFAAAIEHDLRWLGLEWDMLA